MSGRILTTHEPALYHRWRVVQSEKLFRAVVVFGASLTAACEREATKDVTIQPLPVPPASATPTAATATANATTNDVVHDAAPASTGTTVLRRADAGCPPGSELPYPPCYYIR